jgi:hypothetical protein
MERRPTVLARVISFFDSTTKAVLALGGLIAAAAALWAGITQLTSAGTSAAPAAQAVAAHVDRCENQHLLTRQRQSVSRTVAITAYDSCTWPAPSYADADGFTGITVQTVPGPGQTEASDASSADRITGPCRAFALTYDFGFQGAAKHLA